MKSPCISCEFVLLDFRETHGRCGPLADKARGGILNQNKRFLFLTRSYEVPLPQLATALGETAGRLGDQRGECVPVSWELRNHQLGITFSTRA